MVKPGLPDLIEPSDEDMTELLASMPSFFTENKGQLDDDEILFYDRGGAIWFTADGVWFNIEEELEEEDGGDEFLEMLDPNFDLYPKDPERHLGVVLRQTFMESNLLMPSGDQKLEHYSNFFYGNISSEWKSYVPNYEAIVYENIYDNIDLRYYNDGKDLKYDLIVNPGGEVSNIRAAYDGAEKLSINEKGDLVIHTKYCNLIDTGLYIYQVHNGVRQQIMGEFELIDDNHYGFRLLENYDPFLPLIIDPSLSLDYSTHIGGSGEDKGRCVEIDDDGFFYLSGSTASSNFPKTTGAYDETHNTGFDTYIMKFDLPNSTLKFSTFIGGSTGGGNNNDFAEA